MGILRPTEFETQYFIVVMLRWMDQAYCTFLLAYLYTITRQEAKGDLAVTRGLGILMVAQAHYYFNQTFTLHNNRAAAKFMRTYSYDGYGIEQWVQNRPPGRKGIGGRACRGGYNQSVEPL